MKLGLEIGRMKSGVLSYLTREGVIQSLPETSDNFSAARRLAIRSLKFDDDRDVVLRTMVDRLGFMEGQCEPLEERIRSNARENKYVRIIMSIPGVDYYLASLYASYIGDPHRFPSFDHVASFLGIIPVSKDSANVRRRGRMSKDGPSTARWTLGIMVDTVKMRNPAIKQYYDGAKKRKGRAGYARVLTMKKLARMIHHMLITEQNWRWEDEELTEEEKALIPKRLRHGFVYLSMVLFEPPNEFWELPEGFMDAHRKLEGMARDAGLGVLTLDEKRQAWRSTIMDVKRKLGKYNLPFPDLPEIDVYGT
ncbi:MAG: IS110 family transposase [Nitrososphaerota archaeon]|nr:IS110 family transposase [Nitrososphaerota archaeon]